MGDAQRFAKACEQAGRMQRRAGGIGTLSEKTLHLVLKLYYEPDEQYQEIKIGPFVADIVGENGIIEIQTRGFDKLRKKLRALLEATVVTVVYPVARCQWICWLEPLTGELASRRKSPKKGAPYAIFPELYKIKDLLLHENLRLRILLLDVEEVRLLDGYGPDRKKRGTRYDRIPLALIDEIELNCPHDYAALVPPSLPAQFTTADYQQACRLRKAGAQVALHVLHHVGAVRRCGKSGRYYVYERAGAPIQAGLDYQPDAAHPALT